MAGAQEQKLRIRRDVEGLFFETVKFGIHR